MNYIVIHNEDYLSHHGILGQKWGIRRYQNPDGTLTEAGKKRYDKQMRQVERRYDPNAKMTAFRVPRNKILLEQAKNRYGAKVKRVQKLEDKGAELQKIEKAKQKAKQKYAELESEKVFQAAMKRMEMENINDGSYAHNKRVNIGRQFAKDFVAYAGAYNMASITGSMGIGFSTHDRREGTSITRDQLKIATQEAQKAYKEALER